MKVFDYSPIPFEGGSLPLLARIRGTLKYGFAWISDMKSQEIVIGVIQKVLDKRYFLLRNVPLPNSDVTIPFILLGPPGMLILSNGALRGVYRATDENWEVLDKRSQRYKAAQPNLMTRTDRMVRKVEKFLTANRISVDVEGVLVFTDPGLHVETSRPDVRLIMVDAIERFAIRLSQTPAKMPVEAVHTLYDSITTALESKEPEDKDVSNLQRPKISQSFDSGFSQALAPLQQRLNFNRRQWILLGGFVLFDICLLLVFLIFIVFTA